MADLPRTWSMVDGSACGSVGADIENVELERDIMNVQLERDIENLILVEVGR